MSEKEIMYARKHDTACNLFGGVCFFCDRKYGKGFLFHHLKYIIGEKTYRDFPDTIKYNMYIIPIVNKEPERFLLLCKRCHRTLEKLKQRSKRNLIRLLIGLWLTE